MKIQAKAMRIGVPLLVALTSGISTAQAQFGGGGQPRPPAPPAPQNGVPADGRSNGARFPGDNRAVGGFSGGGGGFGGGQPGFGFPSSGFGNPGAPPAPAPNPVMMMHDGFIFIVMGSTLFKVSEKEMKIVARVELTPPLLPGGLGSPAPNSGGQGFGGGGGGGGFGGGSGGFGGF